MLIIILTTTLSIFLLQLPLASSFGYEFSLILAFLFFIAAGLLNLWRLGKNFHFKFYLKLSLLIITIPILTTVLLSFTKDICSFWFGFSFYLIISVVSYILSYLLSDIIYSTFNRLHKTIFILVIIIIALIPLFEIYFNPQIYFYSPIIGYFPGTIYDEELQITSSLIYYRALNLIYFGLFFISIKRSIIKSKLVTVYLFVFISIIFIWFSSEFGFSTTHKKLNNILSGIIESENFILHYDKSFTDSNEILIVAITQEYYFDKLKSKLGFNPQGKIRTYIFNDRKQKKKLFGSEQADVAKPWLEEMYLSNDSWENTLNHELVHIFSGEIGKGLFRLANGFNPALIEGFAEAIDNSYDDMELNLLAAAAYHHNYKIDIKNLFSGLNFFKSFSGLSYLYAGSFSKYLIDNYDFRSFSIFYNSGDSRKAFGKTIEDLAFEYYQFLQKQNVHLTKDQVDYYFGRHSIFQKICPRQIALTLRESENFIIKKKYDEAEKLLKNILTRTPNYSAINRLLDIYIDQNKYSQADSIIIKYLNDFHSTPYFFFMKLRHGDIQVLLDKESSGLENYNFIVEKNPHIQLKLLAKLRTELHKVGKLKDYLKSSDSVKYHLLVNLNREKNVMPSTLPMINLFEALNIPSENLLTSFSYPLVPANEEDSYSLLMLSRYLLKKNDLVNARKLASLAKRKSNNSVYYIAIENQFEKCNWIIKNYDRIVNQIEYKNEL